MLMIHSSAVLTGRLAAGRNLNPHVRHLCLWNLPLAKPKISNQHLTCFASGCSSPMPFPELKKTGRLVWMVKCICWLSATLDVDEASLGGDRASPSLFLCSCVEAVSFWWAYRCETLLFPDMCPPSVLVCCWPIDKIITVHFAVFYFAECVGLQHTLFVYLLIEMPGVFLHTRILLITFSSTLSPSDCESTSFFIVSLAPSKVHAKVCLSFSLRPTVWLIELFWLPGTMRRTETSLWGSISLDHFSWGCATSWMMRSLQQSSSKTRLSPDGFPCQCHFLVLRRGCFQWCWERHLPWTHYC